MVEGRCGYTHKVSRYPDTGAVCCWRPVEADADQCVWHTDKDTKSASALETLEPRTGERLDGAVLHGTSLEEVDWFSGSSLIDADFEDTDLINVDFSSADLRNTTFRDANAYGATFDGANLEDARFDDTDLQKASFQDARLKRTEFGTSRIGQRTIFGDRVIYEKELTETGDPEVQEEKFDAATWTYRRIQNLARRNALVEVSEQYFRREKDLRRRFAWQQGNYFRALRTEGAHLVMGYGRNPWRILGFSALVIVLCALLFPVIGGLKETAATPPTIYTLKFPPNASTREMVVIFTNSLYFSIVAFSTLGYGDIQPIGVEARLLAGIESLLGFGLLALLITVLFRRGRWL